MNQSVQVDNCAVAHGNLSVTITTEPKVSQPGPFSGGQTVVTQQSQIEIKEEKGNLITVPTSVNLAEVVKALNAVGATPQDLLAILQAMKSAGALRAELEII
jgi:flagellar P-ring protein precursor FlgI